MRNDRKEKMDPCFRRAGKGKGRMPPGTQGGGGSPHFIFSVWSDGAFELGLGDGVDDGSGYSNVVAGGYADVSPGTGYDCSWGTGGGYEVGVVGAALGELRALGVGVAEKLSFE